MDAGLYTSSISLLGESHERLLNGLVRDRGFIVDVLDIGRDIGEDGVGRIGKVVVVEETSI